ncbi:MAG: hypothetical protein ACMXYC_03970, partial [Candidatus Woesearchaeota archaeon]
HRMNGDLDTMTAREFASKHGQVAADTLKIYTDNILEYFGNVGYNFSEQPISTAAAMITTAGLLYFGGEVAKFCRTRGQGGYINRVSRFLGNKVFFGGKNQEPF